jgi:hypothetical protein
MTSSGSRRSFQPNKELIKHEVSLIFHFFRTLWHAWIPIQIWIPNSDPMTLLTVGEIDLKSARLFWLSSVWFQGENFRGIDL